ncbi:ribonuclease HII [Agrilactobacillus fermenti]|uniref:ribonuclease HII n=1 Tax=Agrilactobacillus fermenti TaxID=2586909 RepID=UPI001E4925DF|nr:ribonuclease HII [Agrilactobacillus fermenti]MCD2256554.1 ribonuclease HII [Agrilactobacillus fermenti]
MIDWQQQSVQAIKAHLKGHTLTPEVLKMLRNDPRKGVQAALKQYQQQQEKAALQYTEFLKRTQLEQSFWRQGQIVAGIDEVGRGPLAGPVVTCALELMPSFDLYEVNDSKQLSHAKRLALYPKILAQAKSVRIGYVDNQLIDRLNIYEATRVAMARAVSQLKPQPDHLLVDAMNVPVDVPQTKLIHGDARSISIAAASIVAKVVRDDLMGLYGRVYPGYDFEKNMGYGTKAHLQGLAQRGVTPIHRQSFEPIKSMVRNLKH